MKKQEKLRHDLVARLAQLGHRVDDFEGDLRAPLEADSTEQATQMEGDEVTAELEHAAIAEAEQIKAALGRIDAGSYGACATCGGKINPKRLQALPYASECMACAAG